MAIEVECVKCDKELIELGAILLSPPPFSDKLHVEKYHLCADCWELLINEFF